MTDATGRVRRAFDASAARYDRSMAQAERWVLGEQRRWAVSRARGRVLEIAVGTGLDLPLYGEGVDEVVGVDLSPAMLDVARRRLRDRGPGGPPVELRVGDAQALDLPTASVDTVVSTYSLCAVPDPARALDEARRVLRPGGRLVLVEHGPALTRWVRAGQRLLDPVTVRLHEEHLLRDPAEAARGAGFDVAEVDRGGRAGLVHRVLAAAPR